jgi:hypothetical protein
MQCEWVDAVEARQVEALALWEQVQSCDHWQHRCEEKQCPHEELSAAWSKHTDCAALVPDQVRARSTAHARSAASRMASAPEMCCGSLHRSMHFSSSALRLEGSLEEGVDGMENGIESVADVRHVV